MSNSIGLKSGKDWIKAPDGATHVRDDGVSWYKYEKGRLYYDPYFAPFMGNGWSVSGYANVESFNREDGAKLISKEEDLGMNKETKVVKGIEDLEDGLFFRTDTGYTYVVLYGDGVEKQCWNMYNCNSAVWGVTGFDKIISWSYTYNGEYIPIVKETEEERKIKELEATIELAQKQLQEYKRMK